MNTLVSADALPPHPIEALQLCLAAALSCYDVNTDLKGILSRLPREAGPMRESDIEPVLSKLELRAERIAADEAALRALKLPAVIVYADGKGGAYLPTIGGALGEFYYPAGAPGDAITGVYVIHPPEPQTNLITEHMKHGHSLDWFWAPVKTFWKQYAEVIVCSVFINLLVLAMPMFTMNVYDRVAVNFAESTLFVLTTGIIIALLFDLAFKSLRAYVLENVAAKVGSQYDVDLMERMMSIRGGSMTLSVGERANLFRELQAIKDFYAGKLVPALVDLPFFFLFVGVIYILSPMLALVPIVAAVLMFVITKALQVPINRSTKHMFASVQQKSSILIQTLAGMDTIKMLGATGSRLFQWKTVSDHSVEASRHSNLVNGLANNISILMTYLVTVFILYLGVHEIAAGNLTVGAVVAASLLSGRCIGPIVQLSGLAARMKQSSDVLKAIDKVFSLPHEENSVANLAPKGPFQGKIQLSNVTFAYPDQPRPALHNINLTINPGERVGFIGRTGAGKSTLARLVCRFMDPQMGTITIDDYATEAISMAELRRSIGYVPQEGFFFSGSIRSNVLMGQDDISQERLDRATQVAGLDVILQSVGKGLDMEVGEAGNRLSGGQRQAMALARALVRDPRILVFDEPTNGIDNALEATIKANLDAYLQGRTFIMITHRTSLLSLVDRLVLIDRGQVVADGKRDDVLKKLAGPGGA